MGERAEPGQGASTAAPAVPGGSGPRRAAGTDVPVDAVVPAHFDDAVQAARAIAPRRNVWIWVNVVLVMVVCAVALTAGPRAAALVLAAQATLAGVVRLTVREPVAGLEVRGRWLDVAFYLGAAVALVLLALTAPLG